MKISSPSALEALSAAQFADHQGQASEDERNCLRGMGDTYA